MNDIFVFLTVPHAECDMFPKENHLCDFWAPKLAAAVSRNLHVPHQILKGNINRYYHDLNRIESRGTQFRKTLDNIIHNHPSFLIFLLDCHSFPVTNKYTFGTKETPKPEITILIDDITQKGIAYLLYKMLRKNFQITLLPGISNDISDEFLPIQLHQKKKIVIPILLEVREDINQDGLSKIGKIYHDWVNTVNKIIHNNYFVVSPCYGKLVNIIRNDDEKVNKEYKMTIYISPQDIHKIFSPIFGNLKDLTMVDGDFKSYIFQTEENKTGRLYLDFDELVICLEVGKLQYITDRVRVSINKGEDMVMGQEIAEILIGSTTYIFFDSKYYPLVKSDHTVKGGETLILERNDFLGQL